MTVTARGALRNNSGQRISRPWFVGGLDAPYRIGWLYAWSGSRSTGGSVIVVRSFLHVWVIRDEIGRGAMAGILVLPRDGLLIMRSVERIDTHGSPPIEL